MTSQAIAVLKQYVENHFHLDYLPEEKEGNLCYAQAHDEMRPEFRTVFTARDIESYFRALSQRLPESLSAEDFIFNREHKVYLPRTERVFWSLVMQKD